MVPDTDTYICVGRGSGPDIKIIIVTPKRDLPDLLREKQYPGWLQEGTPTKRSGSETYQKKRQPAKRPPPPAKPAPGNSGQSHPAGLSRREPYGSENPEVETPQGSLHLRNTTRCSPEHSRYEPEHGRLNGVDKPPDPRVAKPVRGLRCSPHRRPSKTSKRLATSQFSTQRRKTRDSPTKAAMRNRSGTTIVHGPKFGGSGMSQSLSNPNICANIDSRVILTVSVRTRS